MTAIESTLNEAPAALPEGELAIQTVGLRKQYAARRTRSRAPDHAPGDTGTAAVDALRGIDLQVAPGAIYALLGPNGAGKTTLISILTTLLAPTSGTARVAGFDVQTQAADVRRRIGVTFQEVVLDQELSGRQVLDFHGRLYGLSHAQTRSRIDEVAAQVELSDVLDRRAARYSGGMKRRLELARGLMTAPAVLFLDEPTQGLDPQNRAGVWRYVRDLRAARGTTILLTTHYMEEAEQLADTVGILDHGRLVVEGTPAELVRGLGAEMVRLQGSGVAAALVERLRLLPFVQKVVTLAGNTAIDAAADAAARSAPSAPPSTEIPAHFQLQVGVDNGDRRLAQIITTANAAGAQIHEVSVARPSLGDVFLAHTGHDLRDRLED